MVTLLHELLTGEDYAGHGNSWIYLPFEARRFYLYMTHCVAFWCEASHYVAYRWGEDASAKKQLRLMMCLIWNCDSLDLLKQRRLSMSPAVRYAWAQLLLCWRPSLLGWRPWLVGWRPPLFGWRPLLVGLKTCVFFIYWQLCHQDGLAGWCDRSMQLCLGLALWNGKAFARISSKTGIHKTWFLDSFNLFAHFLNLVTLPLNHGLLLFAV